MPDWLSAYRDVTWHLLKEFAFPGGQQQQPKTTWSSVLKLADFSPLSSYHRRRKCAAAKIGLASATKAFTQTHFARVGLPIGIKKVCLPFGPKFTYFAEDLQCSPGLVTQSPVFIHLCGLSVPPALAIRYRVDGAQWPSRETPSSYQIVARQPNRPSHMSVHEYTAVQTMIASTQRHWPTILRELGASNVNFSSEDTTRLLAQLVTQAGPQDTTGTRQRQKGWVFADDAFRQRLHEQISRRLDTIALSWCESKYMDTMITLAMRLVELYPDGNRVDHVILLYKARAITMDWINRLRDKIFSTEDAATVEKLAGFAMSAAMLCRRTFEPKQQQQQQQDGFMTAPPLLGADELVVYIKASIALQENFVMELRDLDPF